MTYELLDMTLGSPLAIGFEMPGHRALTIPDSGEKWTLDQITMSDAPYLRIASWNHLFMSPGPESSPRAFPVRPFPAEQWDRLNMNGSRAEIAKRDLMETAAPSDIGH